MKTNITAVSRFQCVSVDAASAGAGTSFMALFRIYLPSLLHPIFSKILLKATAMATGRGVWARGAKEGGGEGEGIREGCERQENRDDGSKGWWKRGVWRVGESGMENGEGKGSDAADRDDADDDEAYDEKDKG